MCEQVSDLYQQPEVASELESDLRDTIGWDRKCRVYFSVKKTQVVSFGWSNKSLAIDVYMDGSVFEEITSFKMLGLISLLIWIDALTLSSLLDLSPRNWSPDLFYEVLFPEVALDLYKSTIRAGMDVVMSGLVPLAATWIC